MASTSIEWAKNPDGSAGEVWNPVTGCTKVSQGCKHCYAETIAQRFWKGRKFTDVRCHEDRLTQPLKWKKPRRIFVNSMSDLFHEAVPFEFIDRVMAVINATWVQLPLPDDVQNAVPWHTFIVLTKRPSRALEYLQSRSPQLYNRMGSHPMFRVRDTFRGCGTDIMNASGGMLWPLSNLWLGVSVEDQDTANQRIPILLECPAAVRFISYEPALAPVWFDLTGIHWVICGGESGPGARPMDLNWARSVRDHCQAAGVPYFFKQVGGRDKKAAGRLLDGREWNEFPT